MGAGNGSGCLHFGRIGIPVWETDSTGKKRRSGRRGSHAPFCGVRGQIGRAGVDGPGTALDCAHASTAAWHLRDLGQLQLSPGYITDA